VNNSGAHLLHYDAIERIVCPIDAANMTYIINNRGQIPNQAGTQVIFGNVFYQ
jgi:hypothetical protein